MNRNQVNVLYFLYYKNVEILACNKALMRSENSSLYDSWVYGINSYICIFSLQILYKNEIRIGVRGSENRMIDGLESDLELFGYFLGMQDGC